MGRSFVLLISVSLLWATLTEYTAARRKVDLIESESLKRGSRVSFTPRELNAFAEHEAAEVAPGGLRDIRLQLGSGRGTASARVDFLKVKNAQGHASGWLLSKLLSGERPVTVTARIVSAAGRARVDVERVEISGAAIDGAALDFLIQQYVMSYYPEAKVSQWFALAHRVDHLEVKPSGVDVVIK